MTVLLSREQYILFELFHLQISLMTKIVPSPDWFVGLDSLDLCMDGEFVDR